MRAWSSNPIERVAEIVTSVGASGMSRGVTVAEEDVVGPTAFVARTETEYWVFGESPVQRVGEVEPSQVPIAGLSNTADEVTGGPAFATVHATEIAFAPDN